jgi:hypothetical protein
MKRSNFVFSLFLASMLLISQVGVAFGASAAEDTPPLSGIILKITLESDPTTGVTTVVVKVKDGQGAPQIVRLSEEIAIKLGLVTLDNDGNPAINKSVLGLDIEIDPATILPNAEPQHPVAIALVTFFSDIDGLDNESIMAAHEDGNGFGVIAQALWVIRKLGGDADDLTHLLQAKEDGDFRDFHLKDGTVPTSWNELRRAVADNLGTVMSHKDKDKDKDKGANGNNGSNNSNGNASNNNGNGQGNGNGNGNGNSNGNGHENGNGNSNGNGNQNGNGNGNGHGP